MNTAKRKRKNKEEEGGIKKAFVPNSAHDLAKLQLDKLMKDPVSLVVSFMLADLCFFVNLGYLFRPSPSPRGSRS